MSIPRVITIEIPADDRLDCSEDDLLGAFRDVALDGSFRDRRSRCPLPTPPSRSPGTEREEVTASDLEAMKEMIRGMQRDVWDAEAGDGLLCGDTAATNPLSAGSTAQGSPFRPRSSLLSSETCDVDRSSRVLFPDAGSLRPSPPPSRRASLKRLKRRSCPGKATGTIDLPLPLPVSPIRPPFPVHALRTTMTPTSPRSPESRQTARPYRQAWPTPPSMGRETLSLPEDPAPYCCMECGSPGGPSLPLPGPGPSDLDVIRSELRLAAREGWR